MCNSKRSNYNQMASYVARLIAMYSASVLKSEIVNYILLA